MDTLIDINNTSGIKETIDKLLERTEVGEILEWTFMYDGDSKKDGLPYNTSFFASVGGVSYSEWREGKVIATVLIERVSHRIDEWQELLREYTRQELSANDEKTKLEKEGIQYIIDTLEMAKIAVPIELEKASVSPLLSDTERSQLVKNMNTLQTRIYGESIRSNLDEVHLTLDLMRKEWQLGNIYLTEEEKIASKSIYENLLNQLRQDFPGEVFADIDSGNHTVDGIIETPEIIKAKEIDIPRDDYKKLWKLYIASNGLSQDVIDSENASSIYDGARSLEIPTGIEYDKMNLFNVLRLMVHEVGVHYVNQEISESNEFRIRGANNLEKEEGLATLMEGLLAGKSLDSMRQAGFSFATILVSEVLGGEQRKDYIKLRAIMSSHGKVKDIDMSRDLRVMRGYPLDSMGAQRKDMSYGRGLLKIIALIQTRKYSLTDFFAGKFSIEDISSGRIDKVIDPEGRPFPLFFPEMILYMYTHGRKGFTHEKFVQYIESKYKEVLRPEELQSIETIKDFTKLKSYMLMWKALEQIQSPK